MAASLLACKKKPVNAVNEQMLGTSHTGILEVSDLRSSLGVHAPYTLTTQYCETFLGGDKMTDIVNKGFSV